jgi:hypothetical protein
MPEDSLPIDLQSRGRPELNATQHGCRSQQLLLPHEDPAEWFGLRDMYLDEYDPQTTFIAELMEEAVRMHWFLKRAQTNQYKVQCKLPEDPLEWTAEHHHQIALFTRYQTTAERSFNRALNMLRSCHKDQLRREEKAAPKAEKQEKKSNGQPVTIEQWIEVRNVNDDVVTEFYPSNEELQQRIETAKRTPDFVYRRLFFPDGVPIEYQWTRPRGGMSTNGGFSMQRMTVETWLSLRQKERETGRALSTGRPTLRDWRDEDRA